MSEQTSNKWSAGLITGAVILFIFIPLIIALLAYIIASVALHNKRQKRLIEIDDAKNYLFTELK